MESSYSKALKSLSGIEGVYSNSPSDPGGETWVGISRVNWPKEPIWPIIDEYKAKFGGATKACITAMKADTKLTSLVYGFYQREFWNVWNAENLPYDLAMELFEQSVNLGVGGTAKRLRTVLNYHNAQNCLGNDLPILSKMDSSTIAYLNKAVANGDAVSLQYALNGEQYMYYSNLTQSKPSRRLYYKGWVRARCAAVRLLWSPAASETTYADPVVDYTGSRDRVLQYISDLKTLPGISGNVQFETLFDQLTTLATALTNVSSGNVAVTKQVTPNGVLSLDDMKKSEYWAFWDVDNLPASLAEELVGQTIAIGLKPCAINLQTALNAMNYTSKDGVGGYGTDLTVDGVPGKNTKNRLATMLSAGYAEVVQYALNGEQYGYYSKIVSADPTKRNDWKTWIREQCSAEYTK